MVLHVATTGDDDTGDGSQAKPFASIARAASGADPGSAIRVHAGTYTGEQFIEDLTGTVDQPVWIGGAPGEARPVLSGGGEQGLHISGLSHVIIHDLEIRFMLDNGIVIDDRGERDNPLSAHHVLLRNVNVHGIGGDGDQDCLRMSGVNDFLVLDSEFRLCGGDGGGSGIDLVGTHRGLVARNTLSDFDAGAVQARGGSTDVEIRWNRIADAGASAISMGGETLFDDFRPSLSTSTANAEARHIRALANLIEGSDAPLAFVGCTDCLAAHNTIVDPLQFLLRILQVTTSSGGFTFDETQDGRFVNNLLAFGRVDLAGDVNLGANTQPETFTFSHNLWYAHDAPDQSEPELPVAETGAVIGEDPAFLPGGYKIGPASPAAGAGATEVGGLGDITGTCYAAPPSIGAYEVQGVVRNASNLSP